MIGGKTAAIFAYAARAGALLAGRVTRTRVAAFEQFGTALGLGFQMRDDLLGIWGEPAVTGKQTADDIRRRKKSLPIIMLHEQANETDRAYLESLYVGEEVAPERNRDGAGDARSRRVFTMPARRASSDTISRRRRFSTIPTLAGRQRRAGGPHRDDGGPGRMRAFRLAAGRRPLPPRPFPSSWYWAVAVASEPCRPTVKTLMSRRPR